MNVLYLHMSTAFKRNQPPKLTKTLETNITSEKGDEKSSNITNTLNPNNFLSKIDKYSLYLHQYQKYFKKKLVIKYNILPNEYNLMNIENFICAKYCHNLATFKEMLLFNYEEEFLNRFFPRKISLKKIPLFADFYKSYLKFFCFPTLAELNLNDLIEDIVEKKAKAFYNENYKEESEIDKSQKKINVVIFTNKIRKDISRVNSLSNLTKTSIRYIGGNTNKSSHSLVTIEKLFKELNNEENKKKKNKINKFHIKIDDKFDTKNNNSKNNKNNKINYINNFKSQNLIIKKALFLTKALNKSKYEDISKKNNNIQEGASYINYNRKLSKNQKCKNNQNKLLDSKSIKSNEKNINYSTKKLNPQLMVYTQVNIDSIPKDNINNKNIRFQSSNNNNNNNNNTKRNSIEKGKNSKQKINKINIIKEIKALSKNIFSNKSNTNIKNNIIISNIHYKTNPNSNTNTNTNINNNCLKANCSKQCNTNLKSIKTISESKQNSNRKIQKKTIKIIKKPSGQKINKKKSRNYKIMVSEENTIFTTTNKDIRNKTKIETFANCYFKTKENMNAFAKKMQTTQNSRKRIKKFIRKENKNNINSIISNNTSCSNRKIFNCINNRRNNHNYIIESKIKKISTSLSPSVKNLAIKTQGTSNCSKNKFIKQKNNIQINTDTFNLSEPKKLAKKIFVNS